MIKWSINRLIIFISFKKKCIPRNNRILVYLIVKTMCLGGVWIPQEKAFSTLSTKLVSFLLWYQGIAGGRKNPKIPHQMDVAIQHFMWIIVFKSMRWTCISQLDYTQHCITPKHPFYILQKHHWAYNIFSMVLFILSATPSCWVLLGTIVWCAIPCWWR